MASGCGRSQVARNAIAAELDVTLRRQKAQKKKGRGRERAASPNVALPAAMTPAYNATSTVKDRNVTWRKRRRAPPSPRASDSASGGAL